MFKMLTNCPWYCCAVTFALYLTASAIPVVSSEDVDSKRPWDMVRVARGLQMLRLGKRDSNEAKEPITDEEFRQLLDFLSESRDPTRRQPPLPRYGRELVTRRELLDFLERVPTPTTYMRPPPRAGRYKRSVVVDENPFSRIRSVVRPRIGRYLQPVHFKHLQAKAISRPRIGRDQLYQAAAAAAAAAAGAGNGPAVNGDDGGIMDIYQ